MAKPACKVGGTRPKDGAQAKSRSEGNCSWASFFLGLAFCKPVEPWPDVESRC